VVETRTPRVGGALRQDHVHRTKRIIVGFHVFAKATAGLPRKGRTTDVAKPRVVHVHPPVVRTGGLDTRHGAPI